jgi:hypothetical protein
MKDKICPFMTIIRVILDDHKQTDACMKENCEFWTKRRVHYNQKDEYGCALVLSVQDKVGPRP